MAKQRNLSVDIMKGIAILCVVMGHLNIPSIFNQQISSFHIPLFFIVGGFFYKPVYEYKNKFSKDFKRLLIPYFVVMGLLLIYSFSIHFILKSDHENAYLTCWAFFFPSSIHGTSNSVPVWFLVALFWCRQVFNFIFTKLHRLLAIVVILILSIGTTLVYEHTPLELPFCFMQGVSSMMFFLAGWALQQLRQYLRWYHLAIAMLIWMIGFRYCSLSMILCDYSNIPLCFIIAVCGTLSIYLISVGINHLSHIPVLKYLPKYLIWGGQTSIVILCVHTVDRYSFLWLPLGDANALVYFIVKIALYSFISYLCYYIKITRIIFQLKRP